MISRAPPHYLSQYLCITCARRRRLMWLLISAAYLILGCIVALPLAAQTPQINPGGVVNGASFAKAPAPISPGSIVSIFGSGLATGTGGAAAVPLPTTINGTQVFMNGRLAPLFFVSPGQINAQVPWETSGNASLSVQVSVNAILSSTVAVNLAEEAPGIFTTTQDGTGPGAILHASDSSLATASNPAQPGEFLAIFGTGLGAVMNAPPTGSAASDSPLSVTVRTPVVTIGGVSARVTFSGLAPGFVGLSQINVQVPDNAPAGAFMVTVGTAQSNTVTVTITLTSPPLRFNAMEFTEFDERATVGAIYEFSFCRPPLVLVSDLCGAFGSTTDPTGGVPPYHFKLASGVGFPPFGIFLNPNGILRGVPTAAGPRTFGVCAVDLIGTAECKDLTIIVGSGTLTGTWFGTWTRPISGLCEATTSELTWNLTQSGTAVTGTFVEIVTAIDGLCPDPVGTKETGTLVQGTVDGTTLTILTDGGTLFSGTFTPDTISGIGGGSLGKGPFSLRRQSGTSEPPPPSTTSITVVVTNTLVYPINLVASGVSIGSVPGGETRAGHRDDHRRPAFAFLASGASQNLRNQSENRRSDVRHL